MSAIFHSAIFETPLATVGAVWSQGLLRRILLGDSGRGALETRLAAAFPGLQAGTPPEAAAFAAADRL